VSESLPAHRPHIPRFRTLTPVSRASSPMVQYRTGAHVRVLEEYARRERQLFLLKIKGDRTEEGRSNEKEVSIAQQVRQGQLAANEGITSFLHVEDAARATVLALDWSGSRSMLLPWGLLHCPWPQGNRARRVGRPIGKPSSSCTGSRSSFDKLNKPGEKECSNSIPFR
jgi:hypothetical protein